MDERTERPPAFITAPPRKVLFLCVHNSARSQMAEGFARQRAGAAVDIWSAGTEPRNVHPMAVEVMREVGIDISDQSTKHLDAVPWTEADTVVTLCGDANEVCPAVGPTVRRVHWALPDPSAAPPEQQAGVFRDVRDEIRWRVSALLRRGE